MQQRVCRCLAGCLKHGIGCEPTPLADGVICGYELFKNKRLKIVENSGDLPTGTVEVEYDLEEKSREHSAEVTELPGTVDGENNTTESESDSGREPEGDTEPGSKPGKSKKSRKRS